MTEVRSATTDWNMSLTTPSGHQGHLPWSSSIEVDGFRVSRDSCTKVGDSCRLPFIVNGPANGWFAPITVMPPVEMLIVIQLKVWTFDAEGVRRVKAPAGYACEQLQCEHQCFRPRIVCFAIGFGTRKVVLEIAERRRTPPSSQSF